LCPRLLSTGGLALIAVCFSIGIGIGIGSF
jgi:hypothetical protein